MVFSKQLTSALLAASTAYAASCSSSQTLTIQNQGDASQIASCPKYSGDITINPQSGPSLDFGSLGEVDGTISMSDDSQLATLSFNSLKVLTGGLELNNLTALSTLNLGAIQQIGDLFLTDLAILDTLNLGTNLSSAGDVRIANIQVPSLSGITSAKQIDSLSIANCQYLDSITFQFENVGVVEIGPNNNKQGYSVSFPNLQTATSLFLRNSSSISVPSLTNVSDTMGLYGNLFTSFSAANVTEIGALIIEDNSKCTNFSFPNLVHINGVNSTLDIENNTALMSINGFPKLQDVTNGAAVFFGSFQNISLPSITNIEGALDVETTYPQFDCSFINSLGTKQLAKGQVTCTPGGNETSDPNSPSSSGGSGSGSPSPSHSGNAGSSNQLPTFLTTGAFAALLAFLA